MGALRWTVCLLLLTAGAMAAGYRCRLSYDDATRYSGVDLSNRIGAARTLDQGIDPYTYRRLPDGSLVKRWNEHPYSPPLIWAYVPLSREPYATVRRNDFWLEWTAFGLTMLAAGAAIGGVEGAAWAGALLAVMASQFSWRLHVERGQAYIFLAMLLTVGFAVLTMASRRRLGQPGLWAAAVAGGGCIGVAAVTRPSLAIVVVLLPLCGQWRATLAVAAAAGLVYGATLLAGDAGYWPGYVRVVDRLEQSYLNPGLPPAAGDGLAYINDPTLDDAYAWPEVWKRLRSRSGNLVANEWLWPWTQQRFGWPSRERFPAASRAAAGATAIVAAALIAVLMLRGAPVGDRLAVAAAAGVAVDFFLPVRFEYADVLYVVPFAIAIASLQQRSLVLAILVAACVLLSWEEPSTLGVKGSIAWAVRGVTMVLLPAAVVCGVAVLRPHRPRLRQPTSD